MTPPATPPSRRPPRQAAGFTLIEVMIAIAIMATISLIAWRALDGMSRASTTIELRTEETARLMRALQQVERDLAWRTTVELPSAAAQMPAQGEESAQPADGQPDAPGNAARRAPLLPAGMQARGTGTSPLLLQWVRAAPAAPGRWQRVQWWLQAGTLYRAAGEPSAAYPLPAPQPDSRVAVLDRVTSFEIRAWEPGRGWRRLPAPGTAQSAATGLEVTLGIRRSAGPVLRYRRVIPLD